MTLRLFAVIVPVTLALALAGPVAAAPKLKSPFPAGSSQPFSTGLLGLQKPPV
jgi:hypothetical protein